LLWKTAFAKCIYFIYWFLYLCIVLCIYICIMYLWVRRWCCWVSLSVWESVAVKKYLEWCESEKKKWTWSAVHTQMHIINKTHCRLKSNQVRVHLKRSNKTKVTSETQVSVWDQFWLSMTLIFTTSICLSVPIVSKWHSAWTFHAFEAEADVCVGMHVCLLSHWPWFLSHSSWILPS